MFTALILSLAGFNGVEANEPAQLELRFEEVPPAAMLRHQSELSRIIYDAARDGRNPPALSLAIRETGPMYLVLAEKLSNWASLADEAGTGADSRVTSSARMRLRHRPDLSLRADPPRTSRTAASFLFVFLYAVPSEQREQLDELGRDYLAPVRRTGVDDSFEVYDVVEDGPEARQLIVRASAGAPEFLASEDALNAHTAGPEFDAIGVRAERLLSSVETFPVVRLSERWAPSPWLRGL